MTAAVDRISDWWSALRTSGRRWVRRLGAVAWDRAPLWLSNLCRATVPWLALIDFPRTCTTCGNARSTLGGCVTIIKEMATGGLVTPRVEEEPIDPRNDDEPARMRDRDDGDQDDPKVWSVVQLDGDIVLSVSPAWFEQPPPERRTLIEEHLKDMTKRLQPLNDLVDLMRIGTVVLGAILGTVSAFILGGFNAFGEDILQTGRDYLIASAVCGLVLGVPTRYGLGWAITQFLACRAAK